MADPKNAVQVQTQTIEDEIKQFIFWNYKDVEISDTQMAISLKLAQDYNLSPLRREIHFLKFRNSTLKRFDLQPVIAYTEYLKHAQNTGKLNGRSTEVWVREKTAETKKDMRCTITIYRKDRDHPLKWTIWFSEVAQKNKDKLTWEEKLNPNRQNKADFMLKKVAIAQWMRLAFPEDLGAMPYEESEAWNVEKGEVKPQEVAKSIEAKTDTIAEIMDNTDSSDIMESMAEAEKTELPF